MTPSPPPCCSAPTCGNAGGGAGGDAGGDAGEASGSSTHFQAFRAAVDSAIFVEPTADALSFGIGGGNVGLRIDDELNCGHSGSCSAYGNPPLLSSAGGPEDFQITNVELWAVLMC